MTSPYSIQLELASLARWFEMAGLAEPGATLASTFDSATGQQGTRLLVTGRIRLELVYFQVAAEGVMQSLTDLGEVAKTYWDEVKAGRKALHTMDGQAKALYQLEENPNGNAERH